MRVVVLGASGMLGSRVSAELERRGHDVARASRATGVDAYSGAGLAPALRGAEVVVDALQHLTLSRRKAVDYFARTSRHIVDEARNAEVSLLVPVSIFNVVSPELSEYGYYAGKAVQERTVRESGLPHTIVISTQWYELAETMTQLTRTGPVAVVPHMLVRPVAVDAVATAMADAAEAPPADTVIVAGPEHHDLHDLAIQVAAHDGLKVRILALTPPGMSKATTGLLVPPDDVPGVGPTFAEWLADRPV